MKNFLVLPMIPTSPPFPANCLLTGIRLRWTHQRMKVGQFGSALGSILGLLLHFYVIEWFEKGKVGVYIPVELDSGGGCCEFTVCCTLPVWCNARVVQYGLVITRILHFPITELN